MSELLWSDPQPEPGRSPSKRGEGTVILINSCITFLHSFVLFSFLFLNLVIPLISLFSHLLLWCFSSSSSSVPLPPVVSPIFTSLPHSCLSPFCCYSLFYSLFFIVVVVLVSADDECRWFSSGMSFGPNVTRRFLEANGLSMFFFLALVMVELRQFDPACCITLVLSPLDLIVVKGVALFSLFWFFDSARDRWVQTIRSWMPPLSRLLPLVWLCFLCEWVFTWLYSRILISDVGPWLWWLIDCWQDCWFDPTKSKTVVMKSVIMESSSPFSVHPIIVIWYAIFLFFPLSCSLFFCLLKSLVSSFLALFLCHDMMMVCSCFSWSVYD